ncbi:MAG: hypothetical protein WC748_02945 [Legionellales bacterium]|jgi:hypothetical protein
MCKKNGLYILLLFPILALADGTVIGSGNTNNLGVAATSINSVVAFVYDIVDIILYIGAAILIMSGLLKYRLHRRNPQQVPLSTPVTEVSLGLVLILIAVLVQISVSNKTVTNPNLPSVNPQSYTVPAQPSSNAYPH